MSTRLSLVLYSFLQHLLVPLNRVGVQCYIRGAGSDLGPVVQTALYSDSIFILGKVRQNTPKRNQGCELVKQPKTIQSLSVLPAHPLFIYKQQSICSGRDVLLEVGSWSRRDFVPKHFGSSHILVPTGDTQWEFRGEEKAHKRKLHNF